MVHLARPFTMGHRLFNTPMLFQHFNSRHPNTKLNGIFTKTFSTIDKKNYQNLLDCSYIYEHNSQISKVIRCFSRTIKTDLKDIRTGQQMQSKFVSFLYELFAKEFEHDPVVLFYSGIKDAGIENKNSKYFFSVPEPLPIGFIFFEDQQKVDCTHLLTEILQEAFTKRSLLVSPLYLTNSEAEPGHVIAFAALEDGRVYLIDSCTEYYDGLLQRNIDRISVHLNKQSIFNSRGEKINFRVKYICTNAQQIGDCWLFAWLYAYKIAQRKDIEAFREVNGALFEGRWEELNDYKNEKLIAISTYKLPSSWKGNFASNCFLYKLRCNIADHILKKLESVGNVSKQEARIAKKEIRENLRILDSKIKT